jgi:acetolactate synthase-1/2/3 large subunit
VTDSQPERRNGGRILVEALRTQGVDRIFCVPGESYLPVLDALHDFRSSIDLVVCRQEGGAAIMAEATGKLTGRPGVCLVTRGPGATNASTGIHTAFQDSTPMVMFVGQVGRDVVDREAFQEVDFKAMFAPLAKWSATINDIRRIPEYVHRAFQTAMAGRPGPVVLALPDDMLFETITETLEPGICAEPIPAAPRPDQMQRLAALLKTAERPLAILGGGGWTAQAADRLEKAAERAGLALATSLRCQDYVDNSAPNYIGHFTVGAEPSLIRHLNEADLLIVIGARLGEMTTAGYTLLKPPRLGKTFVHVHADPEELGRVYQADLPINAGSTAFIDALAALDLERQKANDWIVAARADYQNSLEPEAQPGDVNLGEVVRHLETVLPADTIVCSGAGNYTGWAHRHWRFHGYRTQLAPTSGAMGYGVPAAIAASLALPDRKVVAFAGDGCFQMHGQELATAVQYGAKVLFIVVNNGIYGTIRMHQEREFPTRIIGTELVNPDFVVLAKAYGIAGERVERTEDFPAALDQALASEGSALIELVTAADAITTRTTLSRIREAALLRTAR